MTQEPSITSRYTYSWWARHRSAKTAIIVTLFVAAVGFSNIILRDIPWSKTRPHVLLYLLVGIFIVGYILEIILGVPKLFNNIAVTDCDIIFYFGDGQKERIPWKEIYGIDEFDIREAKINDKDGKQSDYTKAMGLGGFRIITNDKKVYRVYKSIHGYKDLKNLLISKCPGIRRYKNTAELV